MKLRVLISLLFIIGTTFASIHELEHIGHDHDSSKCQVCTLSNNFLSADINTLQLSCELSFVKETEAEPKLFSFHFKQRDNHSNAPPSIS
jgi:hypothetical protein